MMADDQGKIVAGHARTEAAKLLGLKRIPVIRLSHLNETDPGVHVGQQEACGKGWVGPRDAGGDLEELHIALPEIGLDVGITGFE